MFEHSLKVLGISTGFINKFLNYLILEDFENPDVRQFLKDPVKKLAKKNSEKQILWAVRLVSDQIEKYANFKKIVNKIDMQAKKMFGRSLLRLKK